VTLNTKLQEHFTKKNTKHWWRFVWLACSTQTLTFCIWTVIKILMPREWKSGHLIVAHNFGKCWPIFKFFFTSGLSSDCLTKWSLKIPPHFKRVTTLPCETLVLKTDQISTLTPVADSPSWAYKQHYWYLQTSQVIWLYMMQYHIIIFDRFSWLFSFPRAVCLAWYYVDHSLPPILKVQWCKRPVWTPDFWL